MEKVFKTLVSNNVIDLIPYIKNYTDNNDGIEILIGCDSQNRKRETVYAVVVGLYTPGKGAHVLYTRYTTPREKDKDTRLINEVWASVELAERIKNEIGLITRYIDIDINVDKKFGSNSALASAAGLVSGLGYEVRYKNNREKNGCPLMTYCADHLVK